MHSYMVTSVNFLCFIETYMAPIDVIKIALQLRSSITLRTSLLDFL